jgi:hypothetical protein
VFTRHHRRSSGLPRQNEARANTPETSHSVLGIMCFMRVYPCDLAPLQAGDVIFRQSRMGVFLGVPVCLGLAGVGVFLLYDPQAPHALAWILAGGGALAALALLRRVARAVSSTNWLVRYDGRRLLVKIGPPLSHDPVRVFAAEFQREEIEWIRRHERVTITQEAGRAAESSSSCLELKLRDVDLADLRAAIATAGAPREWRGWTVSTEIPVSLTGEELVRIEWVSKSAFIMPSLKKALRLLGADLPVQAAVSERNDFTIPSADKEKMDQQIIECVERGQILQATKLARQRYGYSLAEAREFVAQLQGKDDGASGDDRTLK